MNNFLKFISTIFDVNIDEISEETEYKVHHKWDSLMHLRLVAEIEDEYGVEIPIDEVPDIKTLGEFYAYIDSGGVNEEKN